MSRRNCGRKCREFNAELKEEAVQMLLDGHSAESAVSRSCGMKSSFRGATSETFGPSSGTLGVVIP